MGKEMRGINLKGRGCERRGEAGMADRWVLKTNAPRTLKQLNHDIHLSTSPGYYQRSILLVILLVE